MKPYAKSLPLTPARINEACDRLEWGRTIDEHGLLDFEQWCEIQADARLLRLRSMETIGVSTPSSTGSHPERRPGKESAAL